MKNKNNEIIRFNLPTLTGVEDEYISDVLKQVNLSGGHNYSKKVEQLIQDIFKVNTCFLVPSGTHALEMAALIIDLKPGDEVILPSFTFPSTANAFALRGATLKFVDIDPNTMNINFSSIKTAVTNKTKAIIAMHYGGIACEMNKIMKLANSRNIFVIEDAAQGVDAKFKEKYLGSIGHIGCYSFHDTKNFQCGEGGAILINETSLLKRANIIREKGTNRIEFLNKKVEKYTWVDIGSSYLLSELQAAFIYSQLLEHQKITANRLSLWKRYEENLKTLDNIGLVDLPEQLHHNGHTFFIKTESI